jgi:hypothetical protein
LKDADRPDMASLQNYYMTYDPALNAVPAGRLYDSYRYTLELKEELKYKSSANNFEWNETGSDMGGRTRAFMKDPNHPAGTKYWAGCVTGGLWYNNNVFDDSKLVENEWLNHSIKLNIVKQNILHNFVLR